MSDFMMPNSLLGVQLKICVVGAGGTGSILLGGLAQMAIALDKLGHPGLIVTVMDDDTVSEANIGRQAFFQADIGQFKAEVLVNRINQSFGLNWTACCERLECPDEDYRRHSDAHHIWIGCVDTRGARKAIQSNWMQSVSVREPSIWLDCGNTASAGQVILGLRESQCIRPQGSDPDTGKWDPGIFHQRTVLPSAADLFPEMVDESLDAGDTAPSCSLPEALAKQDLFVNRMMADNALNLLWQLMRHGSIQSHGVFVNIKNFRSNPLPIDPDGWRRLGYDIDAFQYKPPASKKAASTVGRKGGKSVKKEAAVTA